MKILVTGALGLVGRAIIEGRPPGCEVELLLDPATQQLPGFAWYRSDITQYARTEMAVTCADPDWVIHCAGINNADTCERDRDRAFRVNARGAEHVARAARAAGARMLMLSTDHIFDGLSGPYEENDRPDPLNAYGASKLAGEQAAGAVMDDLVIVRITHPFGRRIEGTGPTVFTGIADRLAAGSACPVAGDQYTTPAYLPELVQVIWQLVGRGVAGIYHYGTSDRLSLHDMALRICRGMGCDESLIRRTTTAELGLAAKRPLEGGFVTARVRSLLVRPPISFATALLETLESREMP